MKKEESVLGEIIFFFIIIFLLPILSLTFADKILQQMTQQQVAQTNTNSYSVS